MAGRGAVAVLGVVASAPFGAFGTPALLGELGPPAPVGDLAATVPGGAFVEPALEAFVAGGLVGRALASRRLAFDSVLLPVGALWLAPGVLGVFVERPLAFVAPAVLGVFVAPALLGVFVAPALLARALLVAPALLALVAPALLAFPAGAPFDAPALLGDLGAPLPARARGGWLRFLLTP